ncbi:uncharacterized protein LOC131254342 [Magnolia sinica]|uniref:uncharacterized protein LOC131254342 n=1 Tax=Magnolia sinica TaxID=86752 RepID=UPI002658888B|nr:uncharacterized protein LOC131254342 [Magnolia sinica]
MVVTRRTVPEDPNEVATVEPSNANAVRRTQGQNSVAQPTTSVGTRNTQWNQELSDAFLTNFIGEKKKLKPPAHLNNIVQKEGELLKDYIKRFNFESLQVRKHSEETALNFIMQGVRDKPFLASLDKNPPETLAEFMIRLDKYADAEETWNFREAIQNAKTTAKGSAKNEVDSAGGKKRKDDRKSDERKSSTRPDRMFSTYTPLNKPREQVLMEIKSEGFVSWPNKLRSNPNRRNKDKYCHYHRNHGHSTSDCYHLKEEIERLIREGRSKNTSREQKQRKNDRVTTDLRKKSKR